jgi:Zn-dependent protease with chaperone function
MTVSKLPFAFKGTIKPTRLSAGYRFGLLVVGVAMLLLPVLYVGSIALTGTAVWWHLTSNAWILTGKGNGQWRLLVYLGPALAGVVLMFFMVKPILARPSSERHPDPIDPKNEPRLFEFIEAICRQVGAPVPRHVQVDCEVNASAGFSRRGIAGVLSRDLVLTIGLPLAAGLTVRQLGGVIAHEFGHFAQGGGMRLTAIVRGVNAWFARIVFERDSWDVRLEEWSANSDWRLSVVLALARGAVWVSRQLLKGLMMAGHAISCFMLRQMEFDADSYEIKIAGSETFVRTSARMRAINVGVQFGYGDLRESLRGRTLPSDLPAFVVARAGSVPRELLEQASDTSGGRTAAFDTHPCDADRIRAAERAAESGVMVGGDGPATALFADFAALSAAATRHHYEHDLAIPLSGIAFIETNEAIRDSNVRDEYNGAFQRFFGDSVSPCRPLTLPYAEAKSLTRDELSVMWADARDQMAAGAATAAERYRRFEALDNRRDGMFVAQELFCAGFGKVDAAAFGLEDGTPEGVRLADERCADQQGALTRAVEAFECAAVRRLAAALCLGAEPLTQEQARSLVNASNALARAIPLAHELRRLEIALATLADNVSISECADQTRKRANLASAAIANRLNRVRGELADVPCPVVLSSTPMTMAERCGLVPEQRGSGSDIADSVVASYYDIMGRLAAAALRAEVSLEDERARVDAGPAAAVA